MSNSQKHTKQKPSPMLLCILDGWGHSTDVNNNAIALADTPNYDKLINENPHALLATSGSDVGLPDGQMGNSEVGHMNIGGGRVVKQDLPRVDSAIKNNILKDQQALVEHIAAVKKTGGICHLLGLISPGGVHSHQDHVVALAKIISDEGITVHIHAFLDGRDTPPKSGHGYVEKFIDDIAPLSGVSIATVSGRYYAMDRDNRWDRVEKAYKTLASGKGEQADNALSTINQAYDNDITDEFFLPTSINGYGGMKNGDGLLMANFRADRAREILSALADPSFDDFDRAEKHSFSSVAGMVEYSSAHNKFVSALFPPIEVNNNLGQVIANAGMKQLRIAETEKYAHVTFFFNGGSEDVFTGEDRVLIPSPDVATYDLQPEMSADELTTTLVDKIENGGYDLIVVNFANPDMVGHTGILSAAISAVETIDTCLGRIVTSLDKSGGAMLVTADHGNVEQMANSETGAPHTAHTTLQVPVILTGRYINSDTKLNNGCLADIAPTILDIMGLKQPSEMTGRTLIK